jgi:F1F0 ATPase subunit 2
MSEFLVLTLSLAAGLMLGVFFFGGLCWTVIRGISSQRPALWFFGGLLVRMSITLPGFYFVGREYWQRWLSCMLGFILARFIVNWLTRPAIEQCSSQVPEMPHAP